MNILDLTLEVGDESRDCMPFEHINPARHGMAWHGMALLACTSPTLVLGRLSDSCLWGPWRSSSNVTDVDVDARSKV